MSGEQPDNQRDAAIASIQSLLNDSRWKHRNFEKFQQRFKGIEDDDLRRLLIQAGATAKLSKTGNEIWSYEDKDMTNNQDGNTTGRTWADLLSGIPLWILSIAAILFVTVIVFSVTLADKPYSLGFLGTFGPSSPDQEIDSPRMPKGAVVAFLSSETEPCPSKDWELFKPAKGRFIIGAGQSVNQDSNGKSLKTYSLVENGGEEKHQLTSEEMPSHTHGLFYSLGEGPGAALRWHNEKNVANRVGSDSPHSGAPQPINGKNVPHSIMPPFISLYFCIKK